MKAAYILEYGDIDVVHIGEQSKPVPRSGHVIIKMKAASINPIDWKTVKGDLKPLFKLSFPHRLGSDGAGIVSSVGENVSDFEIGDEVYFRCDKNKTGSFAEYFCIPANLVALKPKNMSFIEAASIPLVGLTVMQALREKANMENGSKVLIHAGAGGVGTFAIQYAKACGAYIATTASKKRNALLEELGADQTIDYHTTKVDEVLSGYDIVLDTLGESVHEASYKTLRKDGILVTILGIPSNGTLKERKASFLMKCVGFLYNRKKNKQADKMDAVYKHHLMYASGEQLSEITDLIEAGKIKAVIDSVFPLDKLHDAFARSQTGRAQGKIVITMD